MYDHLINVAKANGLLHNGVKNVPLFKHLFRVELPANEYHADQAMNVAKELAARFPAPEFKVELSKAPMQGWANVEIIG